MNDKALFGDITARTTFTDEAQSRAADATDQTTDAMTPTPVLIGTVILWTICFVC